MTLPASGAISISEAAAEFGISLPCVFPDDFYGKPGMPASGALILPDDFYGKSNVTFSRASGSYQSSSIDGTAILSTMCSEAATWVWSRSGAITGWGANIPSGSTGTNFIVSQSYPASGPVTATSTFTVTATASGVTRNYTFTVSSTRESGGA